MTNTEPENQPATEQQQAPLQNMPQSTAPAEADTTPKQQPTPTSAAPAEVAPEQKKKPTDTTNPTAPRAASLDSVANTTPKISQEEKEARGITMPETSHSKDTQPLPPNSRHKRLTQETGTVPRTYFLMNKNSEKIVLGESRQLPPLNSRLVFLFGIPLIIAGIILIVFTVMRWNAIVPAVQAGTTAPPNTILNGVLWTLAAFFFNVFVLGLYVSGLSVVMKRRDLEKRGEIVWGEVVTAVGKLERSGDMRLTLEYKFPQPNRRRKRELSGKITEKRNDLKDQILPSPGTPVAVLYLHPDNYELL